MTKPQQNELRRSGLGATDQSSAEVKAELDGDPGATGNTGPVPPGNQPGWMARSNGPAKNYPDAKKGDE